MSTQNLGEENGGKGERVQKTSKSSQMCRDESCESSEQHDDAAMQEKRTRLVSDGWFVVWGFGCFSSLTFPSDPVV